MEKDRREHYALIALPAFIKIFGNSQPHLIAKASIRIADDLIKELDKTTNPSTTDIQREKT